MPITAYHLKDAVAFADRIPRKQFRTDGELYRIVQQAPWIWFGLVKNPGPNETVEWRACTMHNVHCVEGEPDAELVELSTGRSFGKAPAPARAKEKSE